MKLLQSFCFFLALFTAIPLHATAEPHINKQMTYYTVEGNTSREIRKSLNERSPVTFNGKKYDAYTEWNVSWKYSYIKEHGSCRLYDISTTATISQTLPQLPRVPAAVRRSWQRYYTALTAHEDHHANFGIQSAREVERALQTLPATEDCQELTRMAEATGRRIVDRYVKLEKQYDRRTNYGAKEGARFP